MPYGPGTYGSKLGRPPKKKNSKGILGTIGPSFAKGLKFKMNRDFNPGDVVLLDSEEAVIITIGITKTVFEKVNNRGIVWRYVPNERLAYLKLEKILRTDVHKNGYSEKKETLLS